MPTIRPPLPSTRDAVDMLNSETGGFMLRKVRSFLLTEDASTQPKRRWRRTLDSLKRHEVLRISKFAIASGIGFLVAEAILVLGIAASYHTIEVPSLAHSSPTILGLDTLALGIGVTVAFIINERVTVKGQAKGGLGGRANWLARWCKYQLAALGGNAVIVGVQLALLSTISLSPTLGSIVGAIVSYPLTYVVSLHFVWGVNPLSVEGRAQG